MLLDQLEKYYGRCQVVGGEKLEECCEEYRQLAEASEEGLGSKGNVVPMIMIMIFDFVLYFSCLNDSVGW